jgi:protein-S-isoprenylcysteine O-methyltransferase Ste14
MKPRIKQYRLTGYAAIFIIAPILTYFFGKWIDAVFSLPQIPTLPLNVLFGLPILFIGVVVGFKATRLLYQIGGGLPWGEAIRDDASSRLVTSGLYSYTKNPMVLGYSLLPFGMGIIFQSPGMAIVVPLIVIALNLLIIKIREEPNLTARFGSDYIEYKMRTPFIFPRVREVYRWLQENTYPDPRFSILVISLVGLWVTALLTYYTASVPSPFQWLTDAIFIFICTVGGFAGVYPEKLRFLHGSGRKLGESTRAFRGHHPPCYTYYSHTLKTPIGILCAGCTGLTLGSVAAVSITSIAMLYEWRFGTQTFWVGFLLVAAGVIQHFIDFDDPHLHAALNFLLVTGVALLRLGTRLLNGGFVLELLLLALTLYWIDSRIALSEIDHERICARCITQPCPIEHYSTPSK